MLEIIGVSKTFNPNTVFEKKALVDINLKVENGEFISIIGANGAGKSTLFNAISGSFLTDKGKIVLDEPPKQAFSKVELIKNLGLDVPQVTLLAHYLREEGIELSEDIIDIDQCAEELLKYLA